MTKGDTMLLQGNEAVAEAAMEAGCRFFAGYPISPANRITSRMAERLDGTGRFIQMEDEIAAISAVIGASWSGVKAMTATSGPGLCLMQEGIGYAYFTETPIVVVDVQRAGPATGQATRVAQGDVMQFRYGSHGDVYPIALAPWSVQELYDLTVRAFNLAEQYRVPVFIATDATVATSRETLEVPPPAVIVDRNREIGPPPFGSDLPDGVPPMPALGDGARLLVTGPTHDGDGFRKVDAPEVHETLVRRLMNKTLHHMDDIVETESIQMEDADICFFSYGISARSALAATNILRDRGIRAGLLRTRTLWPFPEKQVREASRQVSLVVVPECNTGLMAGVVRGSAKTKVLPFSQVNGLPIDPERLARFVLERVR